MPTVSDDDLRLVQKAKDVVSENEKLKRDNERMQKALDKSRNMTPADPAAVAAVNAPTIRKGESVLSSRPFRVLNLLGAMTGNVDEDSAKLEVRLAKSFRKALKDTGFLHEQASAGGLLLPVRKSFLSDDAAMHEATRELLQSTDAGETDRDEIAWMARNGSEPVRKAAMSYLTETSGGALVPPAEFGELIPLMRNKSAIDRAGARQIPLPAQGKWIAPRVTGPTTGYWIKENTAITESNPTLGSVELMAKKLAVLIRIPNELFKFASAASDALFREDVAKTLALGFDYACLYGAGSGGQPKGLVSYSGSNELIDYAGSSPTPKGVAANGNTLRPEDGYKMASLVEERNFELNGFGWVMRPQLKGSVMAYRADSVSAADQAGPFVQAITRLVGDGLGENWCGYKVTTSSQVKNDYTKGASGATLTEAFGGVWGEFLQGVYGAVEFATNDKGEATFIQDQTLIRGIMFCDSAPRYPGAFVRYKELLRA